MICAVDVILHSDAIGSTDLIGCRCGIRFFSNSAPAFFLFRSGRAADQEWVGAERGKKPFSHPASPGTNRIISGKVHADA